MNQDKNKNMIFFRMMVDELVDFSDTDKELKESLKWADEEARRKNISFYDEIFNLLYQLDSQKNAKDWWSKRN